MRTLLAVLATLAIVAIGIKLSMSAEQFTFYTSLMGF